MVVAVLPRYVNGFEVTENDDDHGNDGDFYRENVLEKGKHSGTIIFLLELIFNNLPQCLPILRITLQ